MRICLWFDSEGEEAAKFYTSIFKNSKIHSTQRYGKAGHEIHGQEEGKVMTVAFEINGQQLMALNGGPIFKFNEAISLMVECDNQDEIDYYWNKLSAGGDPAAQQCGWLKDKFGLSWQITPKEMDKLMDVNSEKVMTAMLKMKKIDIQALKDAAEN